MGGGEGDHGASVKSAVVQMAQKTSQVAVPRGGDEESSDMMSAQNIQIPSPSRSLVAVRLGASSSTIQRAVLPQPLQSGSQ